MSPGWVATLIIIPMVISGFVQLARGIEGAVRQYDGWDVAGVLIEIPLMIWGIVYLLNT
jgi:hypothetical protein